MRLKYLMFPEARMCCSEVREKIISSQSQGVGYDGNKLLEPLKKYHWRVRVWDEKMFCRNGVRKTHFAWLPHRCS